MSGWWAEATIDGPGAARHATTATRWPQVTEYLTAVETGAFHATVDRDWRPVEGGFLGGPLLLTGRAAAVFCMEDSTGDQFALRCFLAEPGPNLSDICDLSRSAAGQAAGLIPLTWHPGALKIDGADWPAVTMPWRSATNLDQWILDHRNDAVGLLDLSQRLLEVVEKLIAAGVVHGDLQHGNILVEPSGEISLIDLDGLVLLNESRTGPAPGWAEPNEAGHPNFQHPQRTLTGAWSPSVDVFSTLVIDMSIRAIAANPALLDTYYHEDNLLLLARDLANPRESDAFRALQSIEDPLLAVRTEQVISFCEQEIAGHRDPESILRDGRLPTGGSYSNPWWTGAGRTEVVDTPVHVDAVDAVAMAGESPPPTYHQPQPPTIAAASPRRLGQSVAVGVAISVGVALLTFLILFIVFLR